jgi:hypothetical protein
VTDEVIDALKTWQNQRLYAVYLDAIQARPSWTPGANERHGFQQCSGSD